MESEVKNNSSKAKYVNLAVEAVLLLALIALGAQYANLKTDNAKLNDQIVALQNNPLLVAEKKTTDTIQAVSRLTSIPEGDTPTVSEVTDAESVKKSIVGLTDVQNGDKLLFYFKAGKFIQYRPSTDKIVLNQPLNVK
jgi:hypothetical protein